MQLLIFFLLPFLFFQTLDAKLERDLLVIGCARSGTGYISKALKKCGYDIGHENDIGVKGLSTWLLAVKTDKPAWGPSWNDVGFKHIFHQVRHPLKVISSVHTTEPHESWEYIIANIPEMSWDDSHVVKSAKYWYYWNLKAESIAEWTYRLEDLDDLWNEFEFRLNITLNREIIANIPKDTNTRGKHSREFTWEVLEKELPSDLYENIRALALRYGYLD